MEAELETEVITERSASFERNKRLNIADAFDPALTRLAALMAKRGDSVIQLSQLRIVFGQEHAGRTLEQMFGTDFHTRLKADPFFHVSADAANPDVFFVPNVRDENDKKRITRYNLCGLELAGLVPKAVIGYLCHICGVCRECPRCYRRGQIHHSCIYCHHDSHENYSSHLRDSSREVVNSAVVSRSAGTREFKRRQQVLAKLAVLGVCDSDDLALIARILCLVD
jgi:hypothetical protein